LNQQLLPGLDPKGVPQSLIGTNIPFYYNDLDSFNRVIDDHKNEIGVIIMEPQRGVPPQKGFLEFIRKTADRIGAVLIFDEVTSGFHNNLGGIHLTLGVNPDIAIFAKAMGNGYPISAIIGRRDVMDVAQDTFISSTMWTERIGYAAGLATLDKMKKKNVQEYLVRFGKKIKEGWKTISMETKVNINITGLDSIPIFSFDHPESVAINTFFNQEMLEAGYLANTAVATTYAYTDKIIDEYLSNVKDTFSKIAEHVSGGKCPPLKGPVKHTTFKRLTG
jgi:glutamate-1-semialdehyde aminotransferase